MPGLIPTLATGFDPVRLAFPHVTFLLRNPKWGAKLEDIRGLDQGFGAGYD